MTGFRGEEEFGFNAEPYVRTGKFVKILGLSLIGNGERPSKIAPRAVLTSVCRQARHSVKNASMLTMP